MKIKNFLFILSFLFITHTVKTAELTIYNHLPQAITSTVVWFNSFLRKDISKEYTIASNNSIHVSTGGAYPFKKLSWEESRGIIEYEPRRYSDVMTSKADIVTYNIDIPSSAMMLNGEIQISTNGRYTINFDQNGVSERAFAYRVASPVIPLKY